MINEERLKPMIKMAMFDKNEGQTCKPMIQYAKSDYISLQLLRSFVAGTIAFALLCGMWVMYDTERLFAMLKGAYIKDFLITVLLLYGIFMVVYLTITYLVYRMRYMRGRKKVKTYYKNLKDINKVYEREEKLKTPSQKDWE